MYLRPSVDDSRNIAYHTGGVVLAFTATGLLPLAVALSGGEGGPAGSFILMLGVGTFVGMLLRRLRPKNTAIDWRHGMAIVGAVWLAAPTIAAIPLALSGHYGGWLDAYFDGMSGLTTTGLSVVQDVDHMASSLHVWRHLLQFLGGGGVVVAFLTLYRSGGAALYRSEARDDRLLPSAKSTARFIWKVSLFYGLIGMAALWLIGHVSLGFSAPRALLHAFTIFTAAFSTGGFAPMSTSVAYYHSFLFELVTGVFMILGATSFVFHYQVWHGKRRNVLHNTEVRTYLAILALTSGAVLAGLAAQHVFTSVPGLLRQGLYQAVSAQTTTGFSSVGTNELAKWLGLSFAGLASAMALGSMASSTGGGVKAFRVGITVKTVIYQMRRAIHPRQVVITSNYTHAGTRRRIDATLAQGVMTISLLYFVLYLLGAGLGIAYGYSLEHALFESISAAGTVGLSVGITGAGMPVPLEILYIFQMWIGRLEFIAVFAFFGYFFTVVFGK